MPSFRKVPQEHPKVTFLKLVSNLMKANTSVKNRLIVTEISMHDHYLRIVNDFQEEMKKLKKEVQDDLDGLTRPFDENHVYSDNSHVVVENNIINQSEKFSEGKEKSRGELPEKNLTN